MVPRVAISCCAQARESFTRSNRQRVLYVKGKTLFFLLTFQRPSINISRNLRTLFASTICWPWWTKIFLIWPVANRAARFRWQWRFSVCVHKLPRIILDSTSCWYDIPRNSNVPCPNPISIPVWTCCTTGATVLLDWAISKKKAIKSFCLERDSK